MTLKYNTPYHCLFIDCDTGGLNFSLIRKQTNGKYNWRFYPHLKNIITKTTLLILYYKNS
jgi:hypothetical protein